MGMKKSLSTVCRRRRPAVLQRRKLRSRNAVMKAVALSSLKESSEQRLIETALQKWGGDAYRRTLEKGHAATVLRGTKICQERADGSVIVIAELPETPKYVTQRIYKVK